MPDLLVPSEGYPFISSSEAQWLAVETLFLCRSKGRDFEQAYLGILSIYYLEWARSDLDHGNKHNAAVHFDVLDKTDHLRHDMRNAKDLILDVILNDVQPLRMVLDGVLHGASKEEAYTAVSDSLVRVNTMRGEFERDPEFETAIPRAVKQTSPSRLEGLWRKYADVLHYIFLWNAGYLHARQGSDLEPVQGEERVIGFLRDRFASQKRTNPITMIEPLQLRFLPALEWAEKKRDS